jgi:hypothetical protein
VKKKTKRFFISDVNLDSVLPGEGERIVSAFDTLCVCVCVCVRVRARAFVCMLACVPCARLSANSRDRERPANFVNRTL